MGRRALALALCALAALGAACADGGSAGSGTSGPPASAPSSGTVPGARVALRVDGVPISEAEVSALERDLRFAGQPATRAAAERRAIDDALVRAEAERLGLHIGSRDVDAAYQAQLAQGGVEDALAAAGISLAHFRSRIAHQLLTKRLIAHRFAQLHASERQLRARYRRDIAKFRVPLGVRLSVIQVRSVLQGRTVLRLLHQGRSWRALVRQFAHGQPNAEGDIGWGPPSAIPGRTGRLIARLRVGEIAPTPLLLGASYAVMKVTDRRPAHTDTYSQVRSAIKRTYDAALRQAAFNRWLSARRRSVRVDRTG
jgi:foldase protein PrsA